MRQRLALVLSVPLAAAALAAGATAAGPSLGTAPSLATAKLTYTATTSLGRTTLAVRPVAGAEALRSTSIAGEWGIPRVTLNDGVGGLSHDGRLLVLQSAGYGQPLRATSGFVTVDTRTLAVLRTIRLNGDFAYDALSPNGRTLYLIEHFSNTDVMRYRVRALDLKTGRLLPQIIVDRREPDEAMSGMPFARVATADGRKVFTLYIGDEHPFVHLLDTVARTAFCIDLPNTDTRAIESATLKLGHGGAKLTILGTAGAGARHVVDVKSLRVS